jgi:hypothetical protein
MECPIFASLLESPISFVAEVAQLVEHDLAKVGVAGSSPVFRSTFSLPRLLPGW